MAETQPPAAPAPRAPYIRDAAFARSESGTQLRLTAHYPAGADPEGGRSAVVLVHGGGWWSGSRSDPRQTPVIEALIAAGFVTIVPDYRLACRPPGAPGPYGFPFQGTGPLCGTGVAGQVADVRAAFEYIVRNAARFGVEPGRIGALGMSAGGHLAVLANNEVAPELMLPIVVNWSGPLDTSHITQQLARPLLPTQRTIRGSYVNTMGCEQHACPQEWARFDPVTQLLASNRRFKILSLAGQRETQVPLQVLEAASQKLRQAGYDARTMPGSAMCHGQLCGLRQLAGFSESGMAASARVLHEILG